MPKSSDKNRRTGRGTKKSGGFGEWSTKQDARMDEKRAQQEYSKKVLADLEKEKQLTEQIVAIKERTRHTTQEVLKFEEKPQVKTGWINGGFFVLNKKIFNYIDNDKTIFEREPIEKLVKANQISAFKHEGFWKCMDTLRDKNFLNDMWNKGNVPWKK